jgi:hypothetical protein
MHEAQWFADRPSHVFQTLYESRMRRPHQLLMGANEEAMVWTAPETGLMGTASPRSAGKSTGLVAPNVLMAPGPAICTSVKFDMFRTTAMARTLLGEVWVFAPDGEEIPRGAKQLRWSPVTDDWDKAMKAGKRWMQVVAHGSQMGGNSEYFAKRAGGLLGILLFTAGKFGYEMPWVVDLVATGDVEHELKPLMAQLHHGGETRAARELSGFLRAAPNERSGVITTLTEALDCYRTESSRRTSVDVNFDLRAFVEGELGVRNPNMDFPLPVNPSVIVPSYGWYDTLYIVAYEQSLYAPLIATLIEAIVDERWALAREDQKASITSRPDLSLILDEAGIMAPLPNLSKIAARGGEGVLMMVIFQTLAQAKSIWGADEAVGLLSLFQQHVVFPAVRDVELLEMYEKLGGEYDVDVWTESEGRDNKGHPEWNRQHSIVQKPRFPISDIYNGYSRQSPHLALFVFHGGAMAFQYVTQYWRATPWPELLVSLLEWVADAASDLKYPDAAVREMCQLPIPELDRDGQGTHLVPLGIYERYQKAAATIVAMRESL